MSQLAAGTTFARRVKCLSFGCVLLLLLGTTTQAAPPVLRMHPPEAQPMDVLGLSRIFEEETGIRLERDLSVAPGDDPVESLLDGSADLAVVENTRLFQDGLRVVLNLYQAVVHLSVRQDAFEGDGREDGQPLRLEILHSSHTAELIVELLRERSDGLAIGYTRWRDGDPGEPDVQLYVGPINPKRTDWFREGFTLVPLSRFDPAGAEFYIDGIRYLVPQLQTTRIPALTYNLPGNEEGIEALAVDMLLVSHRRVDASLIYALTQMLVEQKPRVAATEPALFRWLTMDFSGDLLAYPLHRGARQYLERDEPGFLERYAETLNFLVYIAVLLVTGVLAFGRWRARRRKDRIDGFYQRVLALRTESPSLGVDDTLEALEVIERDAFDALISERLAADDSFRIFMELATALRRDVTKVAGSTAPDQ